MEIDYISLEDCKDNHLYVICARNSSLGVFRKEHSAFTLSRFKLGRNYLFNEYHWDNICGSVKPLKKLEKVPAFDDQALLQFLNDHPLRKECEAQVTKLRFQVLGIPEQQIPKHFL